MFLLHKLKIFTIANLCIVDIMQKFKFPGDVCTDERIVYSRLWHNERKLRTCFSFNFPAAYIIINKISSVCLSRNENKDSRICTRKLQHNITYVTGPQTLQREPSNTLVRTPIAFICIIVKLEFHSFSLKLYLSGIYQRCGSSGRYSAAVCVVGTLMLGFNHIL